ncbi:MAG: PDZ domain-containing protein [Planctomycetota bacterium]|jgi:hypothetical protein
MRVLIGGMLLVASVVSTGCGSLQGSPGPYVTPLGVVRSDDGDHEFRLDPDGTLVEARVDPASGDGLDIREWDLRRHPDWERSGIEVAKLPADVHRSLHGDRPWVPVVTAVWLGGPAYRAGVRRGDLVLDVEGAAYEDAAELAKALRRLPSAGGATLGTVRNDAETTVDLVLDGPMEAETSISVPFTLKSSKTVHQSEFRLVFGILGHRYATFWAVPPHQREPAHEVHWGLFADLIKVHSTPESTEVRLLWLIPIRW